MANISFWNEYDESVCRFLPYDSPKRYSFYILEYCKQVLISKTFSYIFAPSFFRNTYLELYLDPEKVIKKE